ncbi:DNA internalization-related competence protein ComEC/Rec2 [Cupriavidus pauculus]|uniref:DNA internalization-related competence protein ComEC/Rec2 n=2 Tax=Pseudomonadota TaxID=1224 RepID=A0A3G8H427_9BURK|nr:DNA internalization-related competence protein ComEC/Rec2 [Cupriavidus pauculus]AZG15015.1 DNA internalization-related competence protein ComEC/Rec2 [Cupriavidus pauculus]
MRVLLLALVAGCWLLQQQAELPASRAWWIGWAVAAMLAGALLVRGRPACWRDARWALVIALAALAAFGWAAWRAELRMDRWLPPDLMARDLVAEGVVAGLPDDAGHRTRFRFNVARWDDDRAQRAGVSSVMLTWRDPPERLVPGQRYRLTVRLRPPRGLANPHGFDYAYWLLAEGIDATGYVREGQPAGGDDGALPWMVRVAAWRAAVRDHLRAAMPADARYGPVLVALVIGDQRGIAQADWEVFRRTGISHLVSISGLHITMVAGAAGAVARGLWRRSFGLGGVLRRPLPLRWPAQQAGLVVTVLAALGYGLLAGMQIPALRTVTMLIVAAVALWSGRAPPVSVVLAWAAGVAVAIDPWAVMSPGFWLSFGAVAVIFFHARRPEAGEQEAAGQEARGGGAPVIGQGFGGFVARCWRRIVRALVEAARAQWAVTVGLVPLTLLLFGQVSVVSCLANAVAIPVVSLFVTPMALASAVLPADVATMLLGVAHALLASLVDGLAWLAAPSWAVWEAAQPGWLVTGLALAGVVVLLTPGRVRLPRLRAKAGGRALPRWPGAVLMLPMLLGGRDAIAEGEMRVTALDVGQGTAVLVETRRHALLYDAGPSYVSGASAGAQVVVPYLRAVGVRRLDMLMVSHEDADHAGGVLDVMRAVPVSARQTAAAPGHRLLTLPGRPWVPCAAGAGWVWDGVRFDVMHPTAEDLTRATLSSNARSCVLRVATAHRSVLLTGDIGVNEELGFIARAPPAQVRADVLVVPHHGSGTSSHVAFLRAVQPAVAVFQLGFANRYRHPREDVWQRYGRAGIARYRTDETGAVTIVTDGDGLRVVPYRQHVRRYWRDRPPAPR